MKMRANYNASLCAGFGKSADARTMENNGKNNGKNNAQSNRNSRIRFDAGRQGDGAARESPPSGMRRFGIVVMPGAKKKPADEQQRATVAQIRG
jgi:hypothetical protein